MPEVQSHGFFFEKWIKNTFFDGYSNIYSSKWDIPQEINKDYGNLPISIKTAKYGSSIGLGDAIRQISIVEDFILIVGYWVQEEKLKRIVNVTSPIIKLSLWKELWNPVNLNDVQSLDELIKDLSANYLKVRKDAQGLKSKRPYCDCLITLNPKIDSKKQRRLQCSINFNQYFNKVAVNENREKSERPKLWGIEVPEPWESSSRTFNKKN